MATIVTTDGNKAQGAEQVNWANKIISALAAGYSFDEKGYIIPKNKATGANESGATKISKVSAPPAIGGTYTVNYTPVTIDLTGNTGTLPRLTTSGNRIKKAGADFALRGVSALSADNYYKSRNSAMVLPTAKSWAGFNCFRVPCTPEIIAQTTLADYITLYLDPVVRLCEAMNIYCILDWHSITDWDTRDTEFRAFWDTVAPRYKDMKHVIYEVYNEPVNPSPDTQAGWDAFRTQMQTWYTYIRGLAPNTLLIIGSSAWDQLTKWIPNNPITGTNIVYNHHIYPGHMPGGSVVDSNGNAVADTDLATKTAWMDDRFGNASNTIPLILTEWGYSLTDIGFYLLQAKSRASFATPLLDYCDTKGISWTAWSLEADSGPGMQNTDLTFNDFGNFVKERLL